MSTDVNHAHRTGTNRLATQTPPASSSRATPVEGDPGRGAPVASSPGLPTTHQINRLRTLLAWCEDHAHALPDGWSADVYPYGSPSLNWVHLDHGDQIAEQIRKTFGQPDDILGDTHWWEARADRPRLTVHYVTPEAGA